MLPNGYWENSRKQHYTVKRNDWVQYTQKLWPLRCSVKNCFYKPTRVVVIKRFNINVYAIVPVCNESAKKDKPFKLKWVQLAPVKNL